MSYEKKNRKFISKPIYEGGEKELRNFIAKNLSYPKEHLEEQISGQVEINIDINSRGKIIGSKILKSLGKAFDQEAGRVVKLLRFNIPNSGARNGKVVFHRKLRINFAPPRKVKKQVVGSMQYKIIKQKNNIEEEAPTVKKSYSYTIQF